jgi:cell division protein FtsW
VPFLIILGLITFLLLKQPATSTSALLLAVALIAYFVSGARISYIISALGAGILILALVTYFTPYRLARVKSFLNPEADIQSAGYHVNQTTMAIGLGGWTGVGYGQSTTKIKYLPEPIGDSIFAVIAEELGFAGATALIAIFFLLIFRMLILAARARDRFAQLLLVGFASLIALQTFINIGAISGIIPLTGMPLPFISYGGTALAVFMTIAGIVVNVSRYN